MGLDESMRERHSLTHDDLRKIKKLFERSKAEDKQNVYVASLETM